MLSIVGGWRVLVEEQGIVISQIPEALTTPGDPLDVTSDVILSCCPVVVPSVPKLLR